jgi:hypothetical protein
MRERAKSSLVWPTIITSAVALMAGCDGASDDLGGGGGASGSEPGKVIPQGQTDKASDFFEISFFASGGYPAPVATHFCTTSFLRGPFNGSADVVYLHWQNQWDSWQFHWSNSNGDVYRDMSAVCTNWNNFKTDSGGFSMLSTGASASSSGWEAAEASVYEWQGDAMMFLRGIAGYYKSDQEFSRADQSTTIAGENRLYVHDRSTTSISTKGLSHVVFAGVPQDQLVKTININLSTGAYVRGNVNSSNAVKDYPISTTSGYSGYWMSPTNDGFCGLTRLGGQFDGAEERVRLYPTEGFWYYKVWAHSGKNVHARARCMAYDQR